MNHNAAIEEKKGKNQAKHHKWIHQRSLIKPQLYNILKENQQDYTTSSIFFYDSIQIIEALGLRNQHLMN